MAHAKAIKRIMKDVEEFVKDPIDGVAIYQTENQLKRIYVVITGPKDSVYQDGFYFFEFFFPDDYPHNPPKCRFLNWQNSSIRMHPNMYALDGKMCLSILGTWDGPSWTSVMSLTTVILAIQSILDDNPLVNEPGYEKNPSSNDHIKYQKIIQYVNMKDFVGKMLQYLITPDSINTESNFYIPYFKEFIKDHIQQNKQRILDTLDRLYKANPDRMNIHSVYNSTNALINYADLSENIKKKMLLIG